MKLIVWKITEPKVSKYHDSTTQRIAFKSLDKDVKTTYYLNLDNKWGTLYINNWVPFIREGNVLDCTLQDNGRNINMFIPPKVIKEVKEKTDGTA